MTNQADPSEWNFAPRGGVDPADRLREQSTRGESPDLKAFLAGHGPHSLGDLVDAIRVDQDQRWQNGERPLAELYLRMFSHVDGDSEAAVDVIFQEFLLRQYYGEDHGIERFLGRFPRHEIHLRDQIEFHLALESDGNATPPVHLHRAQDGELSMIPSEVVDTRTACAEELPKNFGRYRLLKILGTGGMGTVYLAQDAELGRDVALKIPKLQLGACGAETLARFYREARIAARLTHTNLCPIHDIGQWNGTLGTDSIQNTVEIDFVLIRTNHTDHHVVITLGPVDHNFAIVRHSHPGVLRRSIRSPTASADFMVAEMSGFVIMSGDQPKFGENTVNISRRSN